MIVSHEQNLVVRESQPMAQQVVHAAGVVDAPRELHPRSYVINADDKRPLPPAGAVRATNAVRATDTDGSARRDVSRRRGTLPGGFRFGDIRALSTEQLNGRVSRRVGLPALAQVPDDGSEMG